MFGRTFFRVLLILVIGLGAVALGVGAYQAGLAAGLAADGALVAPIGGPYYTYGWHPFGIGFGFLGFLGMLLFFLLIVAIVRAAVWGGRGPGGGGWRAGGWGGPGRWGGPGHADHRESWESRANDAFDEWHRRAHGDAGPDDPGETGAAGTGRQPAGPSR